MHHKPKLVVFDLDGTLAESKQRVPSEIGDLLEKLLRHTTVAIMSGAGWPQFEKQFFPSLSEDAKLENLYIFPENAAQCFVYRGVMWLPQYDQAFSATEREHILLELQAALKETGLDNTPAKLWGEQIEDRGAEIVFSGLGQEAPLDAKMSWDQDGAKRKILREALLRRMPEFSIATGGSTSIDITRKGITKAYGINRLAELTGIAVADMLYVGDALDEGGNDSVVKATGVPTHPVFGPEETAGLLAALLK